MFGAIKPESLRLWKRQHLADFFSWGMKNGIWDETKGPTKKEIGTIIKRKDIKPALGPGLQTPPHPPGTGNPGVIVPNARYDRSAASLQMRIADDGTVLLGPRTPLK